MRAGIMCLQRFITAPLLDHVEGQWIGEVLMQVVLPATGFGTGGLQQRAQVLFEDVLLAGFSDQGGNGGERLGHF
ncbi:hypothetical protein D3C75_1221690 [compost metagenome]